MALPLAFLGQSLGSRVSVSVNDRLPVKRMDMSINDTCNVVVNTLSSYSIKYVWRMWGIIVYSRRRDIDRGHAPQHRVTKPRRVERRKLGVRGTARRQNLFIRYLAHAPRARIDRTQVLFNVHVPPIRWNPTAVLVGRRTSPKSNAVRTLSSNHKC